MLCDPIREAYMTISSSLVLNDKGMQRPQSRSGLRLPERMQGQAANRKLMSVSNTSAPFDLLHACNS
jgi:hypothetical protein